MEVGFCVDHIRFSVLLQCKVDDQDQIELLTIKEEESEVDINNSIHQRTPTKESE